MSEYSILVSIIIPVFNRKDIVFETISSVINQTYNNWELIIVDDGSMDGTCQYLIEIAEKDPRIFFYHRDTEVKGAPVCRNMGIRKSKGTYIIFLDSDDILAPTCLQERLFYTLKNPHLDFLVFPAFIFHNIPGDSQILWNIDKDRDDLVRFLELDSPWQTSSVIWKREALNKLGLWDERLSSWQDMDLHTRALIKKLSYAKINNVPDFYYRKDNKDKISTSDKEIKQFYARIILGENMFNYLKQEGPIPELYIYNLKQFFMWISYSFIKTKHFEGVEAVFETLYRLKIIGFFKKFFLLKLMKINYYFIYASFKSKKGRLLKTIWYKSLYKYFFRNIPPQNCTVKLVKYQNQSYLVNEN